MFLETVRSEGLAHLSYLIGDGGEAFVIDPRRDCEPYLAIADRHEARITRIFETHRNEDYVVGSCELAQRTGAVIHHGAAFPFGYGKPAAEGERFTAGALQLAVLETPGHTAESLSFALYDTATGDDEAVAVFTGDTLFVDGSGRIDLYPDSPEEAAARLHDSIHRKLLPLGDSVPLFPAHGAGSVCGASIAARELSTLGYERRHNRELSLTREAFIRHKSAEQPYQPPYFRQMERLNGEGPPLLGPERWPQPVSAADFAAAQAGGMQLVDLREPEAIAGALIPGSLAIPLEMLGAFAGWFLSYERDIGLVSHHPLHIAEAVTRLHRLGYERIRLWLKEGLHGWEVTGRPYATVPAIHATELKRRLESHQPFTLLDVRSRSEIAAAALPGATEIYLGELPGRLNDIPVERPIVTFCGTGRRSIIAASILLQQGFSGVEVCLGSLAACKAVGCPLR